MNDNRLGGDAAKLLIDTLLDGARQLDDAAFCTDDEVSVARALGHAAGVRTGVRALSLYFDYRSGCEYAGDTHDLRYLHDGTVVCNECTSPIADNAVTL